MKIKSGRTGRARHRWVRNRRIQTVRAAAQLQCETNRLKHCDTCHKPTNGASVQHFRFSKKTQGSHLVKVECQDCDQQARMVGYRKTKRLDNPIMLAAAFFVNDEKSLLEPWMQDEWRAEQRTEMRRRIAKPAEYAADYREVAVAEEEIHHAIMTVARSVWSKWLQSYYRKSDGRGHIAVVNGVEVLVWGCAGRVVMTINGKAGEDLSVIFDEMSEEPRAGRQGIHATKDQAIKLLDFVTANSSDFQAAIKPNDSVSML